jgi:hypothetical protein
VKEKEKKIEIKSAATKHSGKKLNRSLEDDFKV